MSIRKRLASFFFFMTILVVMMGGVLYVGGRATVGAFRQSLDAMHALNSIRELRANIHTQRNSLNRYLLLDDTPGLLDFEEASRASEENLKEMQGQFRGKPPAWYNNLSQQYEATLAGARNVITAYQGKDKAKAHEEWTEKVYPKLKSLFDLVDKLEKEKATQAEDVFLKIRNITDKAGIFLLILFLFVTMLGIVLFRSLYRAVMVPLEALRKGANEFGKGQWDHRIDLPSNNEFGALAKSFNTMADNVKQLQLQAVHMDRMSAVGQLAGGVAHEINNPLTAVLGQAQILLAKLQETDPSYNAIKKIENAGLRCKKIVRGLLDFSRPSQSSFEPIDVNEVVKATIDLCEADLKRARVNCDKRLAMRLPKIQANASELQQVMLNLVNNAIQAMPHGGNIIVETKTLNKPLTFLDRRKGAPPRQVEGPWVEISVKDTGSGIAQEHLNRVFEPFFTTKEIGQGTGLGLAVSMGIVQKHGGDLRVESEGLNRGATFILTLPLKRDPSHAFPKRPSGIVA